MEKIKRSLVFFIVLSALFVSGALAGSALLSKLALQNETNPVVLGEDDEDEEDKDDKDDQDEEGNRDDDEKDDEEKEEDDKDEDKDKKKEANSKKSDVEKIKIRTSDSDEDDDDEKEEKLGEGEDDSDEEDEASEEASDEIGEAQREISRATALLANGSDAQTMTQARQLLTQAQTLLRQAQMYLNQSQPNRAEDLAEQAKKVAERALEILSKDEHEDEEKDDEEIVTRETIRNSDGTVTEKITKIEGDETKIVEITYDQKGNRIMERESESKKGEEKSKITTFDVYGHKLSEYKLKTKDGKTVEIKVKDGEMGASKVRFDVAKQELVIKTSGTSGNDSPSHLRIRAEGDSFQVRRFGINAISNFPMTVDNETGQVFVQTPVGEVELKAMPDTIVQKARAEHKLDLVESATLSDDNGLKYVVTGTRFEKLLGVFTVNISAQLTYDAQTGAYVRNQQPLLSKVLDLFSF